MHKAADASAASNEASFSGESASSCRIRRTAASRRSSWARIRFAGASRSGECRTLATSASGWVGSTSHDLVCRSHSFGPRQPNLARAPSNAAPNRATLPVRLSCSARHTCPAPWSNSADSSGDAATCRDRAHSACAGEADSRSPRPAMRSSDSSAAPAAAARPASTPGPRLADSDAKTCHIQSCSSSGWILRAYRTNSASRIAPRAGRAARRPHAFSSASSISGHEVLANTSATAAAAFADSSGSSSRGWGT